MYQKIIIISSSVRSKDPLCNSIKNFRSFNYDTIVYLVNTSCESLSEERVKYLEISRL